MWTGDEGGGGCTKTGLETDVELVNPHNICEIFRILFANRLFLMHEGN